MKIKKKKLKELVRHSVEEAAKEGRMQKIYRNSLKTIKGFTFKICLII